MGSSPTAGTRQSPSLLARGWPSRVNSANCLLGGQAARVLSGTLRGEMPETSIERIFDHVADIWIALKGIATELDAWNAYPRSGRIFVNGVESMTTTDTPINIPDNDVPCKVDWQDRLGGEIDHTKTDTTWSVEDDAGNPTTVVSVEPDMSDSDEETGTVTFHAASGLFRLVATTQGSTGIVRAQSALYNTTPGAPAVGVITVSA